MQNTHKAVLTLSLLFLLVMDVSVAQDCNKGDREALLELKNGIQEYPSGYFESWIGTECCKWNGILCNQSTGRVINLILPNSQTSKQHEKPSVNTTLSPSLCNLTSLSILHISNWRNLNSPIPSCLGSVSTLTQINLDSNNLTDTIPSPLFNLPNLQLLSLSNNLLTGEIPQNLAQNLTNLKALYLSDNHLSGTLPDSFISCLPSLNILDLHNNLFTGTFPDSVQSLDNLTILQISNNGFSGAIPQLPPSLSRFLASNNSFNENIPDDLPINLARLDLHSNQISGEIPETISKLKMLEILDVSRNRISGTIPDLTGAESLSILFAFDNSLQGPVPDTLSRLPILKFVDLSRNNLSGTLTPTTFIGNSTLHRVILSGNSLSGSVPETLGELDYLEYLDLSGNSFTGSVPNSTALFNLDYLNLSRNPFAGPVPELQNIGVEVLDLSYTNLDMHEGLPPWITESPFLTDLRVAGSNLSLDFAHWSPASPSIYRALDFSFNIIVGGIGDLIDKGFTDLEYLNLKKNNVSGSIPSAVGELRMLQVLDVSENMLSGELPQELGELKNLVTLNVSYNHLCGAIPESPTLQSFPTSSYEHMIVYVELHYRHVKIDLAYCIIGICHVSKENYRYTLKLQILFPGNK